jgi:hypothetical protein
LTISANSAAIRLNSSENPLSVLAGVTVGSDQYGIYGDSSQTWTITNQGTVRGGAVCPGVALQGSGSVTNSGTAASIAGGNYGVAIGGTIASTVVNQGTISGATEALKFNNANGNVFALYPGAVTDGIVHFGLGTGNTLALGSAAGTGTISGIATGFLGFAVLDVRTGASWAAPGGVTIGANVLDIEAGGSHPRRPIPTTAATQQPAGHRRKHHHCQPCERPSRRSRQQRGGSGDPPTLTIRSSRRA